MSADAICPPAPLKATPLTQIHRDRGGRMVPFAGYDMPVQFPDGIIAEHLWTRSHAGLFDVSHMGPSFVRLRDGLGAPGAHEKIAALLETLTPTDLQGLAPGEIRYSLLLNEVGGILDDLMIGRPAEPQAQGMLYVVVNAACKEADWARIEAKLGADVVVERADANALIALQGPLAKDVMAGIAPEALRLTFMRFGRFMWNGAPLVIARSGYTGEDGFEILCPAAVAAAFARTLLADERVKPIGLGARDSLRLEAGLCLYGHDLTPEISPAEASLAWAIGKRRRAENGFPGAERILYELAHGPTKKRIGLKLEGRQPAREGASLLGPDGAPIGIITSGGYAPSLSAPIAMGYAPPALARPGTMLAIEVRGKALPAQVVAVPFVAQNYFRG